LESLVDCIKRNKEHTTKCCRQFFLCTPLKLIFLTKHGSLSTDFFYLFSEVIRNEPCNEKVDIWSFGVLLWELLTCEVPYKNVDSSAIIWGVGSNSLQLPIPSTCPDGYKLLIKQCWSIKPRNRPSFKNILVHLDIAAVEILSFKPDDYFRTQV